MKEKAKTSGKAKKKQAAKPEVTPNLRLRQALMRQISNIVKQSDRTQAAVAEQCGVSQPRINDLLRGQVSRFSLDALVNIAVGLRLKVRVTLE